MFLGGVKSFLVENKPLQNKTFFEKYLLKGKYNHNSKEGDSLPEDVDVYIVNLKNKTASYIYRQK